MVSPRDRFCVFFVRIVVVVSLTHRVGTGPFSPQLVVQMRV